jgi:hypothetical protein
MITAARRRPAARAALPSDVAGNVGAVADVPTETTGTIVNGVKDRATRPPGRNAAELTPSRVGKSVVKYLRHRMRPVNEHIFGLVRGARNVRHAAV